MTGVTKQPRRRRQVAAGLRFEISGAAGEPAWSIVRRGMGTALAVMLVACVLLTPGPVLAQPVTRPGEQAPTRPVGVEQMPADLRASAGQSVRLFVGQSRIMDVPWPIRQASVDRPQVADIQLVRPDRVIVQGKATGATEVLLLGEGDRSLRMTAEVTSDLRGLQGQLKKLFPGSALELEQMDELMIVRGRLARAEDAAQLRQLMQGLKLNFLDATRVAGVQQVQLRVRVAEVSRSALRTLGINVLAAGSDAFGGIPIGSSSGPLTPINIGVPKGAPAGTNLPFQFLNDAGVSSAVTLFAGFPTADLEVFIQALEENEYLQLLAEPNLVALSGEEASFLAGGEFPIPVLQGSGNSSSVTVEYKEFGVRLAFRPVILGDGKIRLRVAPEVSELSDVGAVEIQGFRIPSVLTRRLETTVELRAGQTFGLAGLISRTTNARTSKVPGLGELPVLGALFRSVRYNRNETELVVLVTASTAEPSSDVTAPAVPGDAHRPPNAWELYALGRIEGRAPARLHRTHAAQLQELGLDRLKGPGAWASYGRPADAALPARPDEGDTGAGQR